MWMIHYSDSLWGVRGRGQQLLSNAMMLNSLNSVYTLSGMRNNSRVYGWYKSFYYVTSCCSTMHWKNDVIHACACIRNLPAEIYANNPKIPDVFSITNSSLEIILLFPIRLSQTHYHYELDELLCSSQLYKCNYYTQPLSTGSEPKIPE